MLSYEKLLMDLVKRIERSLVNEINDLKREVFKLHEADTLIKEYLMGMKTLADKVVRGSNVYFNRELMRSCNFCGKNFQNAQAVRAHLKSCIKYINHKNDKLKRLGFKKTKIISR